MGKRRAEDGRLERVEPAGVECEHCVVRRQEAPHAAQPQARSPYSSVTVVPPFRIEYQTQVERVYLSDILLDSCQC